MSRPTHAARADLHPLLRRTYIRLTGCRVYEHTEHIASKQRYPGLKMIDGERPVFKRKMDNRDGYAYISGCIYHVEERVDKGGETYYVLGEVATELEAQA